MASVDRGAALEDTEHAFARLIEAHLDAAYCLATFILAGDRAEAEDAVHDAAVRAWTHFDGLRDRSRFEPWFTRIVVNSCRDRIKARRVRPIGLAEPDGSPTHDHADDIVRTDTLASAMRSLSPEHREAVALRYLGGFSIGEIAARLGVREGTVKSRLHYALRALRASLESSAREVSR